MRAGSAQHPLFPNHRIISEVSRPVSVGIPAVFLGFLELSGQRILSLLSVGAGAHGVVACWKAFRTACEAAGLQNVSPHSVLPVGYSKGREPLAQTVEHLTFNPPIA